MTAASRMWSPRAGWTMRLLTPQDQAGSEARLQATLPGCSPAVTLGSHITPPTPHTHAHVHVHPAKAPFWAEKSALTQPTRLFTAVNSRVTGWLFLRLSVASDPNTEPLSGP